MLLLLIFVCTPYSVFTSEIRLQEDHFSKRAVMIKKYVGEDEDLQLRVLQAVQAAVAKVKHPPGED